MHARWKRWFALAVWLAIDAPALVGGQGPRDPRRPGPDENPQYFPTEVFGSNRNIMAMGYSWYLWSMQEKPLIEYATPECQQVYRVLVETRPYNAPVVVRLLIKTDGVCELVAKVGRDGGHPQILTVSKTTAPPRADVERFLTLLKHGDFWSLPTQKPIDTHHVPMGAAGWMLEAVSGGRYHLVHRSGLELGSLKGPASFLVITLGNLDLRSPPVGPAAP